MAAVWQHRHVDRKPDDTRDTLECVCNCNRQCGKALINAFGPDLLLVVPCRRSERH